MTDERPPIDCSPEALALWKAYRDANKHIVAAGLLLALHGVRAHAPEMKAIKAALRAVNHASGIEGGKALTPVPKEVVHGYPAVSGRRYRKAVP
jgi:hypothetical protein